MRSMRHLTLLVALATQNLTAAVAAPERAAPPPPFNSVLFEEFVRDKLDGAVKGYAFVVADTQGVQARAAGGWGQDPSDGNVRMSTALPSGLGSVSKMLSGSVLLHLFERQALAKTSVAAQLDMRIWPQLPPRFRSAYAGKGWEDVTYRRLLQHRAGVANDRTGCPWQSAESGDTLKNMARGIRPQDVGQRCYANFNYKLLRFLIPAIAYPQEAAALYQQFDKLELAEYDSQLEIQMSRLYERFVRDEFLPRADAPIQAGCRPIKELGAKGAAKHYADRADKTGLMLKSAAEELSASDFCATQGSWFMSAETLAAFGHQLVNTDRWVSDATRRLMWNNEARDDRLPWSSLASTPRLGAWPTHGGSQGSYRAALVMLPGGHVGAALINSGERESWQLAQTLLDAFDFATRGDPVARTRHGLTLAEYQRFATEMDESGSRIDWVDLYNAGDQVFANVIARPAGGAKNLVRHGLSAADYQEEVKRQVQSGKMTLRLVDSYLDRGQVRYAFVMAPGDGRGLPAYHGVDAATHKRLFDTYTGRGFMPTSVSVVSVGGERRFTTSWAKASAGSIVVRSTLDGAAYQTLAEDMAQRKMELVYLNSYTHQGVLQYSAVFAENVDRPQVWRHGLSAAEYQSAFDDWTGKGYGLRLVAGGGVGATQRFSAVWQR